MTRKPRKAFAPKLPQPSATGAPMWKRKMGFRNHWYPVRFSNELAEGQLITLQVLGEKLLIKRIDGKVYAIRDRCLHRGVPLSRKPDCYTKDTITCWYHGYTYRFQTGELVNILAVPDSRLIGRRKIQSFPCQEAKGLIFVFIGDLDPVPPLSQDVPPGFLDDDVMILGKHRVVNSNWRLGAENGFDALHIFIHKDTTLRHFRTFNFPIGHTPLPGAVKVVEDADGPKGVIDDFAQHKPIWDGVIDGRVVVRGPRSQQVQGTSASVGTSIWLPGVLKVEQFPLPGLTQFEWYVPIDGKTHSVCADHRSASADRRGPEQFLERIRIRLQAARPGWLQCRRHLGA